MTTATAPRHDPAESNLPAERLGHVHAVVADHAVVLRSTCAGDLSAELVELDIGCRPAETGVRGAGTASTNLGD